MAIANNCEITMVVTKKSGWRQANVRADTIASSPRWHCCITYLLHQEILMISLEFGDAVRVASIVLLVFGMGIGHAAAGSTSLVLRLEAPAAALACPDCIAPAERSAIARAGHLLSDPGADRYAALTQFLSHGASIGNQDFGGLSLELRKLERAGGGSHYLSI